MALVETEIQGVWLNKPEVHADARGSFHEVFKYSEIENQTGFAFASKQLNSSTSHRGVIRGIHVTNSTQGQAKFVSCSVGSIWDIVVDLRPDSPSFGKWNGHVLSDQNKHSILIPKNVGHAFLSLQDGTVVTYLCDSEYEPLADTAVNVFDETLNIGFEKIAKDFDIDSFILSDKDASARTFKEIYSKN